MRGLVLARALVELLRNAGELGPGDVVKRAQSADVVLVEANVSLELLEHGLAAAHG